MCMQAHMAGACGRVTSAKHYAARLSQRVRCEAPLIQLMHLSSGFCCCTYGKYATNERRALHSGSWGCTVAGG